MKKHVFSLLAALLMMPMIVQAQSGCDIVVKMNGLMSDSWEGAAVKGYINESLAFEAELFTDAILSDSLVYSIDENDEVRIVWQEGVHPNQCGVVVTVGDAILVSSTNAANSFYDGQVLAEFVGCPTCPTPIGLTASYYTATSATLVWIGEAGANYTVAYRAENSDSYTTVSTTTNSMTLSGLDTLKVYYVKVRKDCSSIEMSDWSEEFVFMTPNTDGGWTALNYTAQMNDTSSSATQLASLPMGQMMMGKNLTQTIIDSTYLAGLAGREISHIGFNPTNNLGGYFTTITVYMANVSDSVFGMSAIQPNDNCVFHLVCGNKNMSFTSAGWKVYEMDSTFVWDGHSNVLVTFINNGNSNFDFSAYFASHATDGAKGLYANKMTGSISLNNVNNSNVSKYPCGFTGDLALISATPSAQCPTPTQMMVSDLTFESAIVGWSGQNDLYELYYTFGSNANWVGPIYLTDSSYQLTGLASSTNYIFQVRGLCLNDVEDTVYSDWVSVAFTTPGLPCVRPSDLTEMAVTYGSITVDWIENGDAELWNVHIWNTQYDTLYTTDLFPFTASGLAANTDYNVAVNAICNEESSSIYSDTITIHTNICPTVTALTITTLTSNSASINWSGSGVSYDIEYGDLHFSEGVNTTVEHTTSNSYTLSGLQPEYEYSVSVRQACEEGVYSSYCTQVDFKTFAPGEGIETASTAQVYIYPNPTSDRAIIHISGITGTVEISIVDLNGQIVWSASEECTGDYMKELQVSGLAAGTYFVRANGMVRRLVVK